MLIKYEKPPIWDEACRAFNLAGHKPIFAWGNTIYQPFDRDDLNDSLLAHERVHGLRQLMYHPTEVMRESATQEDRVLAWWHRYLADPQFRLDEELPAHRAELGVHYIKEPNRKARRRSLTYVAGRMCSPLYAWPVGMLNLEKAKAMLKEKF